MAAKETSDLIVMGIGRRGMLDRILHGTNVPQVIRHATCPVLTLRAQAAVRNVVGTRRMKDLDVFVPGLG
jgi:hypothetical protein